MAEESQTLTMDETSADAGEFTPEEMDSLKVGEEMAKQQDQLLAGKYKTAEDLESAYINLQKKLGEPKADVPEETSEPKAEEEKEEEPEKEEPKVTNILDKLWAEKDSGFKDETLQELASAKQGDLAKAYLLYRQQNGPRQLSQDDIGKLKRVAGGEERYNQIVDWAQNNLNQNEQTMYDAVVEKGDPIACYFALQALMGRYENAVGTDGTMLTGKASKNDGSMFRSQQEVIDAMGDPRYDRDPAYRKDIENKLKRSKVKF